MLLTMTIRRQLVIEMSVIPGQSYNSLIVKKQMEIFAIITYILGELLDCKSESSYIDCLNPDNIDCMVHCILAE